MPFGDKDYYTGELLDGSFHGHGYHSMYDKEGEVKQIIEEFSYKGTEAALGKLYEILMFCFTVKITPNDGVVKITNFRNAKPFGKSTYYYP